MAGKRVRLSNQRYVKRVADDMVASKLQAVGAVVIEGPKACGKTETARQHAVSEVLLDVDPEENRTYGTRCGEKWIHVVPRASSF